MSVRELYTAVSLQASFKTGWAITEVFQVNVERIKKAGHAHFLYVFYLSAGYLPINTKFEYAAHFLFRVAGIGIQS